LPIKHPFVCPMADSIKSEDVDKVKPSYWNAGHIVDNGSITDTMLVNPYVKKESHINLIVASTEVSI